MNSYVGYLGNKQILKRMQETYYGVGMNERCERSCVQVLWVFQCKSHHYTNNHSWHTNHTNDNTFCSCVHGPSGNHCKTHTKKENSEFAMATNNVGCDLQ